MRVQASSVSHAIALSQFGRAQPFLRISSNHYSKARIRGIHVSPRTTQVDRTSAAWKIGSSEVGSKEERTARDRSGSLRGSATRHGVQYHYSGDDNMVSTVADAADLELEALSLLSWPALCSSLSSFASSALAKQLLLDWRPISFLHPFNRGSHGQSQSGDELGMDSLLSADSLSASLTPFDLPARPWPSMAVNGSQVVDSPPRTMAGLQDACEKLLDEVEAAIAMEERTGGSLNFGGVDTSAVSDALRTLLKGMAVSGRQAAAVAVLLRSANGLRRSVADAVAESEREARGVESEAMRRGERGKGSGWASEDDDDDHHHDVRGRRWGEGRATYLLNILMDILKPMATHPPLAASIATVVDEDGHVKDTASSDLLRARSRCQLAASRAREAVSRAAAGMKAGMRGEEGGGGGGRGGVLEQAVEVGGRYCMVVSGQFRGGGDGLPGLVVNSNGTMLFVEPHSAVQWNDKYAEAAADVDREEQAVLLSLSNQMREFLADIHGTMLTVVRLDTIVARARYSSWLGACRPHFTTPSLPPHTLADIDTSSGAGATADLHVRQAREREGSGDMNGQEGEEPWDPMSSSSSSLSSPTRYTSNSSDTSTRSSSNTTIRSSSRDTTFSSSSSSMISSSSSNRSSSSSSPFSLELTGLRHPLLLQQHRAALKAARQQAEAARKVLARLRARPGAAADRLAEAERAVDERKGEVSRLEQAVPVPIDVRVRRGCRVVTITGPNTGGKTATIKAVGLAAVMARAGLFVLSSPTPRLPLFPSVFADIGDAQSLSSSLSTFSSHLARLTRIIAACDLISNLTLSHHPNALVLLDEIGSGTDPSEGAAIATAVLEHLAGCHVGSHPPSPTATATATASSQSDSTSAAAAARPSAPAPSPSTVHHQPSPAGSNSNNNSTVSSGALLTMATTHHGELKALKYTRPGTFENACVEFDDERLAPTYRLLWGLPGRSNALHIAHKLGLPQAIISSAQQELGQQAEQVNEVIIRMEEARRRCEDDMALTNELLSKAEYLHASIASASERQAMHRAALRRRVSQRAAAVASETQRAIRAAARAAVVAGRGQHEWGAGRGGGGQVDDPRQWHSNHFRGTDDDEGLARFDDRRGAVQERAGVGSIVKARAEGMAEERGMRNVSGGEGRGAMRHGSAKQKRQVVTVGAQVMVKRLGRKGEVVSMSESKGEAIVRVGMMNVTVPLTEL